MTKMKKLALRILVYVGGETLKRNAKWTAKDTYVTEMSKSAIRQGRGSEEYLQ